MPKPSAFNQDVINNQGYIYTTNASLSSQLANQRMTDLTLQHAQPQGKKVLDIGCGDGVYSLTIAQQGHPQLIFAGDVAEQAVRLAQKNAEPQTNLRFIINSAYELPFADQSFDLAILRGVLHHLDQPQQALSEALRVAQQIWVIEPNGYNPGLKLLEKISPYHRAHDEKSYPPHQLDRWIEQLNGQVTVRQWAGFVPMFCPDPLARTMKWLEPFVENTPLINKIASAIYTFTASHT